MPWERSQARERGQDSVAVVSQPHTHSTAHLMDSSPHHDLDLFLVLPHFRESGLLGVDMRSF